MPAAGNSGTDAIAQQNNTTAQAPSDPNATAGPTQILKRAVVVEVLYDLCAYPEEDWEEIKQLVAPPEVLETAPRNSIICRLITAGADRSGAEATEQPTEEEVVDAQENNESLPEGEALGGQGILCYPFFPPHLCFPVKPGEQVWVISDAADIANTVQYWMCRIPDVDHVDDINFTHNDRRLVGTLQPPSTMEVAEAALAEESATDEVESDAELSEGAAEPEAAMIDRNGDGIDDLIFGFPNGPGTPDAFSLKEENAYEDIVNVSTAYDQFRRQSVPRFTKRPGDFVLQGSHNTLICLGEDRGWGAYADGAVQLPIQKEHSNATEDENTLGKRKDRVWGTIDMVAGRGRYDWKYLKGHEDMLPWFTAARCIENTPILERDGGREPWVEVNKNPQESGDEDSNRLSYPVEGDPDFHTDAARITISHASAVDSNYNIDRPGETIPNPIGEECDYTLVTKDYPSSVVAKADEIRLIARKFGEGEPIESPYASPEINGTIRIIKEGKPDEDLAAIVLFSNGDIQISGNKIFLGRAVDDGGLGEENKGPGEGSSQPYVKYQQLEDLLKSTMGNIQSFCDTLLGHVTPGYGAPSPQINSAAATLKADMGSRMGEIVKLKSERIFGE